MQKNEKKTESIVQKNTHVYIGTYAYVTIYKQLCISIVPGT